jgi:hypothetical protein
LSRAKESRAWRDRSISKYFAFHAFVLRGAVAALAVLAVGGSWLVVRHRQQAERDRLQSEATAHKQREDQTRQAVGFAINENRTAVPGNNTNLNANQPPANSNVAPGSDATQQQKAVNKRSPQPSSAQVASLFLLPFSSRDGSGSSSLVLSPDTRAVRLRLAFKEDDHSRYDVVLRTLAGEQVLHRRALKAYSGGAAKKVTLTIDPSIFRHQDYIIILSGLTGDGKLEAIGEYYFRAERSAPQSAPTPTPQ